ASSTPSSSSSANSSSASASADSCVPPAARSSVYRSSRCWASSSTTDASMDSDRPPRFRRRRTSPGQSCILHPRDPADRLGELEPAATLRFQLLLPGWRDAIVAATSGPSLLHPPARDQLPLLQPVQQRRQRCRVDPDLSLRARLDQLAQLIAVVVAVLQQGENEEWSRALLEVAREHGRVEVGRVRHMW